MIMLSPDLKIGDVEKYNLKCHADNYGQSIVKTYI
jgi:hypothetical protein